MVTLQSIQGWHSKLSVRVPECQKIKRMGYIIMAWNALVDSLLPQSEKSVGVKGLNMQKHCATSKQVT